MQRLFVGFCLVVIGATSAVPAYLVGVGHGKQQQIAELKRFVQSRQQQVKPGVKSAAP